MSSFKKTLCAVVAILLSHVCGGQNPLYAAGRLEGKKILHIESYHEGYEWSDGIVNGVQSVLKETGVELEIFRMDTKRNPSEEWKQQVALKTKAFVESFKPDVIIASDDNASKYVIMPFYKNGPIPVVFCGINWDASIYGYPYANATGMIEVDPIEEMQRYFKRFAKGLRVAYIAVDNETDRSIGENMSKRFVGGKMQIYLVKTFAEFKQACLNAQKENDALLLNNNAGIIDWNHEEFIAFADREIKLPSGTTTTWMAPYTLFAVARMPEEQGSWAAGAALRILEGTPPAQIEFAYNKMAVLTVNMRVAKKLGVFFDLADLQRARILRE
ncbi:MAG: ABC transporter substrate binding protein [Desulfatitalea sp.]